MKTNLQIKNNKYDVRGFTLIELLAVIVVLAIVMLIAVQAVLPKMDESRRRAFAIEANGLIKSAIQYVISDMTFNGTVIDESGVCLSVKELVDSGNSTLDALKYKGKVMVFKNGNQYLYRITMNNGSYMVVEKGINNNANVSITEGDVDKYVSSTTNYTCS